MSTLKRCPNNHLNHGPILPIISQKLKKRSQIRFLGLAKSIRSQNLLHILSINYDTIIIKDHQNKANHWQESIFPNE